ncbi:Ubiquitin-specific protease family C19-related protein [Perilla frutescens var. hirtella]|uniref:Ubiquitin-specific protease family C19-related protein n=1 Tax=Perilla frutescens var. hirtella TaxID=608512 RepID=A0AAD4J0H6_PERFH|nr:Ubiquitin-specific protease family C19-related protein [Perilla frutescens var. hirtella]
MGTRTGSHQLSSGLMVSGRPERQLKDRQPTMSSRTVIYTGGDVKKSGELGKMYGVDISRGENLAGPPRPPSAAAARSGPIPGAFVPKFTNSGHSSKLSSSSSFSGPATPIQPTGLITSGRQGTPGSNRRSGQLDAASTPMPTPSTSKKANYGSAVTSLGEVKLGFGVSRVALWMFLVVVVLTAAGFLIAAVKKVVTLAVAAAVLVPAVVIVVWNHAYRKKGVLGFLRKFPDSELRNAVDGQFVKVTGVVTCGGIALETSYQRVPRCVYVSSELHEYRGCGGEKANAKHRLFSWGCRDSETYVADFYISDNKSGERALVKTGYGAKVSPFVKLTVVVNAEDTEGLSPNFLQWLSGRGLSSEDRVMHLKEGYIKEGYTVSVLGVFRRHNNMFTIVPPTEPISTGFQWRCCLLPASIDGLILINDENDEAIPV